MRSATPSWPLLLLIFTLSILASNPIQAASRKFHPIQPAVKSNNSKPNLSLLSNLEYDQEIRGLKIPAHWVPDLKQDLFIGRATIQPTQAKLWSIGWKPALKLENVTFNGSLNELGSMLAKLSRSARTPITIEHLSTTDHQDGSLVLIAENGNWRQLTP
jgi:hypothetical protein